MRREDFLAAMTYWAEADDRATAALIESVAALILVKLNPPARGDDVVSVSFSHADVAELYRTHHFEARYDSDGSMEVFVTPLDPLDDVQTVAPADDS